MPYSSVDDVKFWGQFDSGKFGSIPSDWNEDTSIQRLIDFADGEIDDYCQGPKGFFVPNGVVVENEYHDGKHVASGNKPLLRPDYLPVLSVVKLEYLESGSWTTKTEGNSNDYVVLDYGIILITLPNRTDYKNIRLTYKCGYTQTPDNVVTVSGKLAAAIGQLILDSKDRKNVNPTGFSVGLPEIRNLSKIAFTDDLKSLLTDYRLKQIAVYRG